TAPTLAFADHPTGSSGAVDGHSGSRQAAAMLLVGEQAIGLRHPALGAPASAYWDVWVSPDASAAGTAAGLSFHRDAATGDDAAIVEEEGRRYRFTRLAHDDARWLFLELDGQAPLVTVAGGRRAALASSGSLASIERAQLYRSELWHGRVERYHRLRGELDGAGGASGDGAASLEAASREAAYEALRAQVLSQIDAAPFQMRVSNEAFFGTYRNAWLRWHPHDQLHRATCYGDTPLYETLKQDLSQAYVPRAGFEALGPLDRIRLAREECYALALERVLIPAEQLGISFPEPAAFQSVLRRLCTDLARGWFRDFAIDCYAEILDYDTPFWQRYCAARERGELSVNEGAAALADRPQRLRAYWNDERERDRFAGLSAG
ncbi:MAG: hypothetical protein AB7S98_19660, partial [Burkholderiaceae bacterium]